MALDVHTIARPQAPAETHRQASPTHPEDTRFPPGRVVLSAEEAPADASFLRHKSRSRGHLHFLSDHQAEGRGVAREEWARGWQILFPHPR